MRFWIDKPKDRPNMATRPKTTPTATTDPVTPDQLSDLRAQQQAIRDQIKALKATAQLKRDLTGEIARQEATPNKAHVVTVREVVSKRVQG